MNTIGRWYYVFIIALFILVLSLFRNYPVIEPNPEYLKADKLQSDLISEYERLQPLPGAVLISSSRIVRSGKSGIIGYGYSTELSDLDILSYYDKQFKANGWIFQKVELNTEGTVYAKGEYIAKIGCFNKKEKGVVRFIINIIKPV